MNNYDRVAEVIRFLDAHHCEQPDLEELAAHLGLSPFHFHRVFTEWAGVTPKDFLQCLTLAHVKTLLRKGENVLNSALEAGLSGPGRLHDLCLALEAASPGEVKSGGRGWRIDFGFADSTFGRCLIAEGPRGICYLAFMEGEDEAAVQKALREAWPRAELSHNPATAARLVPTIFQPAAAGSERPRLRACVK